MVLQDSQNSNSFIMYEHYADRAAYEAQKLSTSHKYIYTNLFGLFGKDDSSDVNVQGTVDVTLEHEVRVGNTNFTGRNPMASGAWTKDTVVIYRTYEIIDTRNNFQEDFEQILIEEASKDARKAPGVLVYDWYKDRHKEGLYVCVEIYANKRCEFLLYNKSVAGRKLREFAKYGGPLRIHKKLEG